MNRDDLLKRCVDRRVAHETSVVAVSHLFYVYLLSALKKGQRVEVPNFGTFGTHVVGVKRQRRMPFFEVENDLAEKVNERYRNLRTLVLGKYELVPTEGEVEYEGPAPPQDAVTERLGKEIVIDPYHDVSPEEFQQSAGAAKHETTEPIAKPESAKIPAEEVPAEPQAEPVLDMEPTKEKKLMPKLNLRGEGFDQEPPPQEPQSTQPPEPPPTLREFSTGTGTSPVLQILGLVVLLALVTFALNHFGIIHLWGTKEQPVQTTEETLPPVQPAPQQEEPITSPQPGGEAQQPEAQVEQPAVTEQPPPAVEQPVKQPEPVRQPAATAGPPAGTGQFTIQVSSWPTRETAEKIVGRLSGRGFDAYIAEGLVKGKTWYRVRVGRYASSADARAAADRLKAANENGVWVTKID